MGDKMPRRLIPALRQYQHNKLQAENEAATLTIHLRRGLPEQEVGEQMTDCIGRDPLCPCQDGDPCHYLDHGETRAMLVPDFDCRVMNLADEVCEATKSGALVGLKNRLHLAPLFDGHRAEMENCHNEEIKTGWLVKYPLGFEQKMHTDASRLIVYWPEDHPSGLVVKSPEGVPDENYRTHKGGSVEIWAGTNHSVETIIDRPRYAVVWVAG